MNAWFDDKVSQAELGLLSYELKICGYIWEYTLTLNLTLTFKLISYFTIYKNLISVTINFFIPLTWLLGPRKKNLEDLARFLIKQSMAIKPVLRQKNKRHSEMKKLQSKNLAKNFLSTKQYKRRKCHKDALLQHSIRLSQDSVQTQMADTGPRCYILKSRENLNWKANFSSSLLVTPSIRSILCIQ